MSKRHGIFAENFTISFEMHEKLKTRRNLYLRAFRRLSLGGYTNVTLS